MSKDNWTSCLREHEPWNLDKLENTRQISDN